MKRFLSLQKHADRRYPWSLLSLLYVIAFVIRLSAAMSIGLDADLNNDEKEYVHAGQNVAQGIGYALVPQGTPKTDPPQLTAFRMPGPSLAMAAVTAVFGTSVQWLRLAAAIVSSLSVPLMFLFVRQLALNQSGMASAPAHKIAFVSAIICAVYPLWILHSVTCLSEPYAIPAMLLTHMLIAQYTRRETACAAIKSGALWGLLTFIKPYGLPMTLLGAAQLWLRSRCRAIIPSIAIGLGFLVVLSPWVYRNYVVFERFIPLATEGSETLLGANNPYVVDDVDKRGMWLSPMQIDEYKQQLEPFKDELSRADERKRIAMKFIREDPSRFAWMAFYKLRKLYSYFAGSGLKQSLVVMATWGTLFTLFIIGVLRRTFTFSEELQLFVMWLFMQSVVTIVYSSGYSRGRLPMEILLIPWGVISARSLWINFRAG